MARQRRRNRRRRRGSYAFLYKILAFFAICGAIVAAMALFFKVSDIEVSGNSRYTAEEVVAACGVVQGDNLFLLNKYEMAEKIRSQLPYVSAVRISRHLPDALCIELTECDCVVGIEQAGKLWLLCSSGKLVDAVSLQTKTAYPRVTGVTLVEPAVGQTAAMEDADQCRQLLALLTELGKKEMLEQVQSIDMKDASLIAMQYTKDFEVQLNRHADFSYKLDYLAAVLQKLEENERGTIILTEDGEARFIPR